MKDYNWLTLRQLFTKHPSLAAKVLINPPSEIVSIMKVDSREYLEEQNGTDLPKFDYYNEYFLKEKGLNNGYEGKIPEEVPFKIKNIADDFDEFFA